MKFLNSTVDAWAAIETYAKMANLDNMVNENEIVNDIHLSTIREYETLLDEREAFNDEVRSHINLEREHLANTLSKLKIIAAPVEAPVNVVGTVNLTQSDVQPVVAINQELVKAVAKGMNATVSK